MAAPPPRWRAVESGQVVTESLPEGAALRGQGETVEHLSAPKKCVEWVPLAAMARMMRVVVVVAGVH